MNNDIYESCNHDWNCGVVKVLREEIKQLKIESVTRSMNDLILFAETRPDLWEYFLIVEKEKVDKLRKLSGGKPVGISHDHLITRPNP